MDRQSDKITALYCRIGYPFDGRDTTSAHAQLDSLSHYAREHGLKNLRFYCDWGFSGADPNRPQYLRMLHDVLAGKISELVVLNLSRLARDSEDAWKLIGDTFPQYSVVFHSVQDGVGIGETLERFSLIRQELKTAYYRSREGGRD